VVCQCIDNVLMAHEGGHVDGRQARLETKQVQTKTSSIRVTIHTIVPLRRVKSQRTLKKPLLVLTGRVEQKIGLSYLSDSLDRCSMFQQQLHHFHSVLLAGDVKRSETVLHTERRKGKVGGKLTRTRASIFTQSRDIHACFCVVEV